MHLWAPVSFHPGSSVAVEDCNDWTFFNINKFLKLRIRGKLAIVFNGLSIPPVFIVGILEILSPILRMKIVMQQKAMKCATGDAAIFGSRGYVAVVLLQKPDQIVAFEALQVFFARFVQRHFHLAAIAVVFLLNQVCRQII